MPIGLTENDYGVFRLDETRDLIEFDGERFLFRNELDATHDLIETIADLVDQYEHRTADGQYIHGVMQYIVKRLEGDVLSIPDPDIELSLLPKDAVL